jgi:plasmid stabilization system protein ParE
MAKLTWSEPALADLDEIADYVALDDVEAARRLVSRVFRHVEQLEEHPESGSVPKELSDLGKYRQIVEPPCRVFYRTDGNEVYVVHVMRGEMLFQSDNLVRD